MCNVYGHRLLVGRHSQYTAWCSVSILEAMSHLRLMICSRVIDARIYQYEVSDYTTNDLVPTRFAHLGTTLGATRAVKVRGTNCALELVLWVQTKSSLLPKLQSLQHARGGPLAYSCRPTSHAREHPFSAFRHNVFQRSPGYDGRNERTRARRDWYALVVKGCGGDDPILPWEFVPAEADSRCCSPHQRSRGPSPGVSGTKG